MSRSPCRRRRSRRPYRVLTPEDAIDAVLASAADLGTPRVLGLLLDRDRAVVTAVAVDDPPPRGRDLDELLESLVDVAAATEVAALVLATVRPGRGHEPTPADLARWTWLVPYADDAGVELLDWFVLSDGFASSLAELTGVGDRWPGP